MLAPAGDGDGGARPGHDTASLVHAARRLADELLAPAAQDVDRSERVPLGHLEALAGAGLQRLSGPVEFGGAAAPVAVTRTIYELLAGACATTFFVWVQHHAPVRMLADSNNAELKQRYLADLCSGRLLGGVAFAYLRRSGPPAVVARAVPGGFAVSGEAPWVTGWGLAGLLAVAARLQTDKVLFFCLPARASPAVRPSPPLALAAMGASATVRLVLDDVLVPAGDVVSITSLQEWHEQDRLATARPNPAVFGIAAACCRLLAAHDATAADGLGQEVAECRDQSYRLADHPGAEHVEDMVRARAWSLDVALRSAQALVAAVGGRAMELSHPAQRLLREAAFFTIQAQTPASRQALLSRLTAAQPARKRGTAAPAAPA